MRKLQCTINQKELNVVLMMLNMKKIVINALFSRIFIFFNHRLVQIQELILLYIKRILLIKILIELKKQDRKNCLKKKLNNKDIQ